jgi:hypothetical protein
MIDEGIITRAIEVLVNAADALASVTKSRGTRINFDPGKCPWLGIYPGQVDTSPKTIGAGSSRWKNNLEPQVVLQTADYGGDGQAASDQLEALVGSFLEVVDADLTLGVTGARVVGVSREYRYVMFDGEGSGDLFMPQVVIKLKMEMRSA